MFKEMAVSDKQELITMKTNRNIIDALEEIGIYMSMLGEKFRAIAYEDAIIETQSS